MASLEDRWVAFVKALGVILVSEIGDKTFFIAAVMAMRNSRFTVYTGALGALAAMTVLSAGLGWAAPALIPKVYTHWAAAVLFLVFGLHTLYSAFKADSGGESELQQVEQELNEKGSNSKLVSESAGGNDKEKEKDKSRRQSLAARAFGVFFSPIFIKAFSLTFLAEWGDRSQITTIGLAASEDVYGVTAGGILGHAICTGAAVLGGRHLAAHINERAINVMGGLLFLAFGAHAVYTGP